MDNVTFIADGKEELSLMLHILDSSLSKFKLKINSGKTKSMVIDKVTNSNITLNDERV